MKYPLIKPKYYYSLFKEITAYVKRAESELNLEKTTRIKIYDTIGLYILKMVFLIPVVMFFAIVYDPENVQKGNMSERFTPFLFVIVGGLLLPLVEEVAFRLSLRFKPVFLGLSSTVLCYYMLTKLVFHTKISAVDDSFLTRVAIAIIFGTVVFLLANWGVIQKRLVGFWRTHFRSIYYISCLLFAWVHITKYEINWTNVLLLPILTLPQLMSAIIYGYTRVSYGFQYPLVLHMSNNLVGIGLSLLPFTDFILL